MNNKNKEETMNYYDITIAYKDRKESETFENICEYKTDMTTNNLCLRAGDYLWSIPYENILWFQVIINKKGNG